MIQRSNDPTVMSTLDDGCEWCQQPISSIERYVITVADSSYTHPEDPSRDGRRVAAACCVEHAHDLAQRGDREWNDEQFWASQIARSTARARTSRMTLGQLAQICGLTPDQVDRALRWRTGGGPLIPHQHR